MSRGLLSQVQIVWEIRQEKVDRANQLITWLCLWRFCFVCLTLLFVKLHGHLVIICNFFWTISKTGQSYLIFYLKSPWYGDPVNTARVLWHIADRMTGSSWYCSKLLCCLLCLLRLLAFRIYMSLRRVISSPVKKISCRTVRINFKCPKRILLIISVLKEMYCFQTPRLLFHNVLWNISQGALLFPSMQQVNALKYCWPRLLNPKHPTECPISFLGRLVYNVFVMAINSLRGRWNNSFFRYVLAWW